MKKEEVKENNTNTESFGEQQQKYLSELFSNLFGGDSGLNQTDAKDIEAIKIILAAVLNKGNLKSLTNLSEDEIDDINDALMLNEYYDNPRINIFINDRLELSRSKTKNESVSNLLHILADISGKAGINFTDMNEKNSILGRFRGR